MAKSKKSAKTNKKQVRGRSKLVLPAILIAVIAIGGALGWMAGSAHVTRLRYANVYLQDLPAAFDGTTCLFLSDIDIRNASDSAASVRLMRKLQDLNPDLLLLGGDYTANGPFDAVKSPDSVKQADPTAFIESLGSFQAPMGKFAVTGEQDDDAALEAGFIKAGVQLLNDRCAAIEKDGEQLVIAGLSDTSRKSTPYEQIGGYFTGDECVIALTHNPSAYVGIRVAEARGGGAWADLVLAGHTLGGQVKLFGRTMRTMPEAEARTISGWYYPGDLPMLVSEGLGCKGAKLRLGTRSEIWLITLRRPQAKTLPKLGE